MMMMTFEEWFFWECPSSRDLGVRAMLEQASKQASKADFHTSSKVGTAR